MTRSKKAEQGFSMSELVDALAEASKRPQLSRKARRRLSTATKIIGYLHGDAQADRLDSDFIEALAVAHKALIRAGLLHDTRKPLKKPEPKRLCVEVKAEGQRTIH